MKLQFLSLAAGFAYLAQAGDVRQLGDSDFKSAIASEDLALVKFYAPWCGHCKKMAPEYEKAATTLAANDPPVMLAEVDCTVHQDTCQKHGVSGYPTLKIFRNGEASEYNGGRSANDFVKIMAGQAGPASAEIKDVAKVEKVLNSQANVVIGFFESEKADGFSAFTKAANELRESVKFSHTFSAEVAAAAGAEVGQVVLFRPKVMKSKFEDQTIVYDKEKFSAGLIRNWAIEKAPGLAPVVEPQDFNNMGFPRVVSIFNVNYDLDPKGTQYWRNRVMKVAQNYPDLKFAVGAYESWGGLVNELGLNFDKSPIVVLFKDAGSKYVMNAEFDPKGVAFGQFLDDFQADKLTKHVKSEEEPASQGANLKLTANNFDTHVDGSKDAFIKFHAPWCGHCKSLAPKWEEMAAEFENDENVVIGEMDATANDVPPQFEVSGFPTMYWVPKGSLGNPVKYQQARETKDLVNYVKNNRAGKDEL